MGAWLVLSGSGLVVKVGGGLLLGLAFLTRPRLGNRPSEGVLSRADAPSLYALADEIADSLDTARPHLIAVSPDFNASWMIVGVRRERVLSLGLPLLAVLEPQERVALIAHELAHARNGDATTGLIVGSAVESLGQLYVTLSPGYSQFGDSDVGIAELISRPAMWLLAQPIRLLLLLELLLLLRDSQRAEYLADGLAAQVGGTEAVIGLHEKLLLEGTAEMAVHRVALSPTPTADVFEALRAAFDGVPERERERRRRVARLETARLGVTHPPTGKRIELLERREALAPNVLLAEGGSAAIERELDSVRPGVSRRLVEEYRATISW